MDKVSCIVWPNSTARNGPRRHQWARSTVRHQPKHRVETRDLGCVDMNRQRHVTAASVAGEHASETAEPQFSSIQAQRVATWSAEPVPFGTFEPAKNKDGWVGQEALAGIGWVDVTALGSAGEHASETAEPQQDSGPTGCHLVGRAGAIWHLRTR